MRRAFRWLVAVVACVPIGFVSPGLASAQAPPNVVLVIADDLGWPYTGFMGDPVALTPRLNALAAEGTVFTQSQTTASVCAPSHRTLLSGIHSLQWSYKEAALEALLGRIPYREEVVHYRTLPRELAHAGYRSFEGGKMWAGTYAQAGFTEGLATSIGGLFGSVGEEFGRTDIQSLRDFLDHVGAEPFFAWFAPKLPHVPFDAPPQFRTPYELLGRPWWEVDYYSNVSWFDAVVGELLDELDTRGLTDSTLIVVLSDNGWELGVDSQFGIGSGKGKGTLHELGTRTPLIFRWPGRIPAGVVRDDLVSSEDLEPTLLDYAGADPVTELRGRSLVPAIQTGAPFGRDKMVTAMEPAVGGGLGHVVRTAAWRYILFPDGHEELYDIVADPYETTDVVAAHADLLPGFRADVQAWDAALVIPPPSLEVTGRLTDATTGQPIAGAQLDLELGEHAVRSITGDDGWFAFRALPQGSGLLAPGSGTINVQRLGSTLIQVDLPVGALGAYLPVTGTVARTLSGPLDGEIRGRLRDLQGQPLSRQGIRVRGRTSSGAGFRLAVLTDLDGSYRVEQLPAGVYRLKVRAVGYRRVVVETSLATSEVVVVDLSATPR